MQALTGWPPSTPLCSRHLVKVINLWETCFSNNPCPFRESRLGIMKLIWETRLRWALSQSDRCRARQIGSHWCLTSWTLINHWVSSISRTSTPTPRGKPTALILYSLCFPRCRSGEGSRRASHSPWKDFSGTLMSVNSLSKGSKSASRFFSRRRGPPSPQMCSDLSGMRI